MYEIEDTKCLRQTNMGTLPAFWVAVAITNAESLRVAVEDDETGVVWFHQL